MSLLTGGRKSREQKAAEEVLELLDEVEGLLDEIRRRAEALQEGEGDDA